MIYYAIKHEPTGRFLPATKRRRGFTNDEPESTVLWPPRLFPRRRDAEIALKWWLKGEVTREVTKDYYGDVDEVIHVRRIPRRRASEMRVVRMALAESGL